MQSLEIFNNLLFFKAQNSNLIMTKIAKRLWGFYHGLNEKIIDWDLIDWNPKGEVSRTAFSKLIERGFLIDKPVSQFSGPTYAVAPTGVRVRGVHSSGLPEIDTRYYTIGNIRPKNNDDEPLYFTKEINAHAYAAHLNTKIKGITHRVHIATR